MLYKRVSFDGSGGRPRAFGSPIEMWERAVEYFEWCEKSTINESKVFNNQGEIVNALIPHMRAMTQHGLCSFLNIGVSTWHDYKNKAEFSEVTEAIEQVMYEQKFTGAAAGMLKENIIARDLGIIDKDDGKISAVVHNIMPVPMADSADDWEAVAKQQQAEMLSNHD